jgi:hypothetical protein
LYATATDAASNTSTCSAAAITYVEVTPPPSPPPAPPIPPAGSPAPPAGAAPKQPSAPSEEIPEPVHPGADTIAPAMKVNGKLARLDSRGIVAISIACPTSEPGGCSGTVTLRTVGRVPATGGARRLAPKRPMTLGRRSFELRGGTSGAVRVRLSPKSRRLIRKLRRLRVFVFVDAHDGAGNATTARSALTLKSR